jgi:hypothetical protein
MVLVLVLMVLLHGELPVLMTLHVVMLVGGRMLLFLQVDNGLLLMGLLVLSHVLVLVLWQLPVLVRGQLFLLLMVGGGLQLMVVVLSVLVVVGVLQVGFLQLLVLVGDPLTNSTSSGFSNPDSSDTRTAADVTPRSKRFRQGNGNTARITTSLTPHK